MLVFANAKINLGLNIVSRRPDGYHNLLTCFYPVGINAGKGLVPQRYDNCADVIEAVEADCDSFNRYGTVAECPDTEDLTYRSLKLFRDECPSIADRKFAINLYKRLPFGAGLGGGSADAGFTLRLLNNLSGASLSEKRLAEIAVRLGADCPFFIYNKPLSASGIGDIFKPLPNILDGYWGAIVKPDCSISTREAFRLVTPRMPEKSPEDIVISLPPEEWKDMLTNDFEQSMFALYPHTKEIKREMYDAGAVYASLSGSGSAFYAIFKNRDEATGYLDRCKMSWCSAVKF